QARLEANPSSPVSWAGNIVERAAPLHSGRICSSCAREGLSMIWLRPRSRRRARRGRAAGFNPAVRRSLCLEPLEDRLAPAVFTVTHPGPPGWGPARAGDLPYCLTQPNAPPGLDTTQFAIAGTGLQPIRLNSALPAITDSVAIDGYTQAGASPNTLATGD